ncbi:DUF47 domain-containing protein [Cyanobium sp. Morenito 9A2]|uniref:DUF47 domain-containing protein n=1 Tax=Cyanobium sp. Morenito 9A2 TaxID=2823718 RepID=UPI0020CF8CA8|nr:DUF47 family protein [Cyanobium sp. Morenito 9A2]MCP9850424.1 DUF47 family protein [Cyanobium sp. Morenito 9A2]
MAEGGTPVFGKTRFLEGLIEELLDKIVEGSLYLELGVKAYLASEGRSPVCQEKLDQILQVKEQCAELRRRIATLLYSEMLIPDARGDVFRLLGDLFELLDDMGNDFQNLMIEQPTGAPTGYRADFEELNAAALGSVRAVLNASRTFFRDPAAVRDHINEVRLYEAESDRIALRIKTRAFATDHDYESKCRLRNAADMLDGLADKAERLGDELAIFAIKRAL